MTRSQRHQAELNGYCSRDSTIAQGAWSPCTSIPTAIYLEPDNAVVGDTDVDVHIVGHGFSAEAQVVASIVVRSTYVSSGEIIITVQPSKVSGPGVVPIVVQIGYYKTAPINFTFTAPPGG